MNCFEVGSLFWGWKSTTFLVSVVRVILICRQAWNEIDLTTHHWSFHGAIWSWKKSGIPICLGRLWWIIRWIAWLNDARLQVCHISQWAHTHVHRNERKTWTQPPRYTNNEMPTRKLPLRSSHIHVHKHAPVDQWAQLLGVRHVDLGHPSLL